MSHRYVVKEASQMVNGEPTVMTMGHPSFLSYDDAKYRARSFCADFNAGKNGQVFSKWGDPCEFIQLWAIVDTQDEWHSPKPQPGRYIVKLLSEMKDGEPTVCRGWTLGTHDWAKDMNAGRRRDVYPHVFGDTKTFGHKIMSEAWVVDTHDEWHRCTDPSKLPDVFRENDLAIVRAYEEWQREDDTFKRSHTGVRLPSGSVATLKECQDAWSREMKRKQAEAKEASRHRITCEGALPEDY